MAYKKYGPDTIIESEAAKIHVSYGPGSGGFVALLLSSVDEDKITHAMGTTFTAKQARELAAALVHYAKEIE